MSQRKKCSVTEKQERVVGLSRVLLNAHKAWHRATGSPGVSLLSVSDCISRFPQWQLLVPAYVDKTSLSKYFPSKVCVVEIQVRLGIRTRKNKLCLEYRSRVSHADSVWAAIFL